MGADVGQPKPSDYIPRSAETFVIRSVADHQTTRGQLAEERTTLVTEFCQAINQLERGKSLFLFLNSVKL